MIDFAQSVSDQFIDQWLSRTEPTSAVPIWRSFPGPQTLASESLADELLYGGAAGGGKTDLLLGLAASQHRRSIIFRREFPQLKGIFDRAHEIIGDRGRFNATAGVYRLHDGRMIEFASCPHEWDVQRFQGRPHDFIAFDEASQFSRSQYRFLIGWNRSTTPRQRCRVLLATNPPTNPEGRWIVEEFAPWLDDHYPDPAEPGELRWYSVIDGKLEWFNTSDPVTTSTGEVVRPRSRTFIPARLDDNPALRDTGYKAVLQGMPEPLRSQMLYGDFNAGTEDDEWQVIPTAWVRAAQKRWTADGGQGRTMATMGVDPARGGKDQTAIACRYGTWVAPLLVYPGESTPDGPKVAQLASKALLGHNPEVRIDVIGIGASVYDTLKAFGEEGSFQVMPINFAAASEHQDRTRNIEFVNIRAAAYWQLREALDPDKGDDIALPPDNALLADLCAARWQPTPRGIKIESKEDIIARLGRSPDRADAVVLALYQPRAKRRFMIA